MSRSTIALLALGLTSLGALTSPIAAERRVTPAQAPAPPGAPSPIALSDPDGQDLVLESLSARAALQGPLSLTELTLVFRNAENRRREGRFTCVLPAGATVSRFAKEVNGVLMEGEVVERLRANQVYDQILHQMRDPALLETDEGSRFSARIFPIEPLSTVRLVLGYTQLLPAENGRRRWTLPLRGLPRVGELSVSGLIVPLPGEELEPLGGHAVEEEPAAGDLRVSTIRTFHQRRTDVVPEADLEVVTRLPRSGGPSMLTSGDFFLASRTPPASPRARPAPAGPWLFLVDTSASAAEGLPHRLKALSLVLASLPPDDVVELVAFDQTLRSLGRRRAIEWSRQATDVLTRRGFLGGTDLEAALRFLAGRASVDPSLRAVLVSDGMATLGKTAAHELSGALEALPAHAFVAALTLGSRQDAAALTRLTEGRGRVVNVPFTSSLEAACREAGEKLRQPVGETVEVVASGVEWLQPRRLHDLAPGREVLVVGKRKPSQDVSVTLKGDGRAATSEASLSLNAGTFGPLLAREAWRGYLAHLSDRASAEADAVVRDALSAERVRLSVEHRVLVPETTLLVLESEADYARFGLARRALSSILTVGATGIERLDQRPAMAVTGRATTAAPRRKDGAVVGSDADLRPANGARVEQRAEDARAEESLEKVREAIVVTGESPILEAAPPPAAPMPAAPRPAPLGEPVAAAPEPSLSAPRVQGDLVAPPAVSRPAPPTPPARRTSASAQPVTGSPGASSGAWERYQVTRQQVETLLLAVRERPSDRLGWVAAAEALLFLRDGERLADLARRWQPYDPENPMVYECWGEAALLRDRKEEAARAFGSLVEVATGRPELLQRGGLLLLRAGAGELSLTPIRRAVELRPDRANAHRHLALVLWQLGRSAEAARVLEEALAREYPGPHGDVRRVMREELACLYRALLRQGGPAAREVRSRARERGVDLTRVDALRVTLAWETDANDVDLHVIDPEGEEVWYSRRSIPSGLTLDEDVTRGFGPEVVHAPRLAPGRYRVGVRYYATGPMGVVRGVLLVVEEGGGEPRVRIEPFRLPSQATGVREVLTVGAAAATPGSRVGGARGSRTPREPGRAVTGSSARSPSR